MLQSHFVPTKSNKTVGVQLEALRLMLFGSALS